jgi:ADP-ribose pyrophosphatase
MSKGWKPRFETQDVQVLKTTPCHHGFIKVDRLSMQFPLFKGGLSEPVLREVAQRPSAVAVLLYDPEHKQVVMIEQFRAGAFYTTQSPWLLEVVAGVIEPSDTPEQAAIREVLEETGLNILSLIPICHYLPSPAILSENVFLYCATVHAPKRGGVFGLAEEAEDIQVHVFSTQEAFEHLAAGHIVSAPAWISLQWLQRQIDQKRL